MVVWKGPLRALIALCLVVLPVLLAHGESGGQSSTPARSSVSADELRGYVEGHMGDYLLVDVRTPEEYASGHIPTAVNIPLSTITEKLPTSDRGALIILYCASGHRAALAREALVALGYRDVINFGALSQWRGPLKTKE